MRGGVAGPLRPERNDSDFCISKKKSPIIMIQAGRPEIPRGAVLIGKVALKYYFLTPNTWFTVNTNVEFVSSFAQTPRA